MDRLRTDARVAILAFAIVIALMAVASWYGYDRWWIERYY
jgi:hypothetical protein